MSASHTPAPWKVSHDEYAGHYDVSTLDAERGSEAIAQVLYTDNEPGGRGEADAHLIAAAPALLEALEAIDKVVSGYKSQMKFCDIEALGYFREFVRRIEATKHAAALSLAKGESA